MLPAGRRLEIIDLVVEVPAVWPDIRIGSSRQSPACATGQAKPGFSINVQGKGLIRKAVEGDIARLFEIRNGVRENLLDDPASVSIEDVRWFILNPGIFVWEENNRVEGFSAADPRNGSVWALFVDPAHEGRGIGQALFRRALSILEDAGYKRIWLTTGSATRAEAFYRAAGWNEVGRKGDELLFEASIANE